MSVFAIVSQAARPTLVSVSKRTAVRTYFATPSTSFSTEEPKHIQEDKVHHQMAPLTDSTVYSPQGTSETNNTTVFSPIVNTVFDE